MTEGGRQVLDGPLSAGPWPGQGDYPSILRLSTTLRDKSPGTTAVQRTWACLPEPASSPLPALFHRGSSPLAVPTPLFRDISLMTCPGDRAHSWYDRFLGSVCILKEECGEDGFPPKVLRRMGASGHQVRDTMSVQGSGRHHSG